MPEESTTPDLAELTRRAIDAADRRDFDAMMTFYAPDAVYDFSRMGMGTFEGLAAIRVFYEEWLGGYEEYEIEPEQILDLGNEVVFAITRQTGTPAGSTDGARMREVWVYTAVFTQEKLVRLVAYGSDIDEGRAATERLAEERGWPMSENLDLVRTICAAWGRGDFASADWAHPDIDFVIADGPEPGRWTGRAGMAEAIRSRLSAWSDARVEAEEYRELDGGRVLVLSHYVGRGKTSGLEVGPMGANGANLFYISNGKVTRQIVYWDRDRALAALGLAE
jgi:ketosteroid isomerase-like protein